MAVLPATETVQIDLESAADADRAVKDPAAASQIVHVETRGVNFDRATGTAKTDQPVTFVFPSGSGDAVGAEYNSEEGTLRLLQSVQLRLKPTSRQYANKKPASSATEEEVQVTGTSLEFGRDARTIHILGPTQAQSRTARLTAGELDPRDGLGLSRAEAPGHRRFERQAAGTYITTRRRHHPRQRGQVDRVVCNGRMGHSSGWDGERTWLPSWPGRIERIPRGCRVT